MNIIKVDNISDILESTPVTNNPVISNFIVELQLKSFTDYKKNLSRNLIKELTDIFGKPNNHFSKFSVWTLELDNLKYNIFTEDGKGTYIEMCGVSYNDINKGKYQEEILSFLNELYNLINFIE